jgi:hypothetical protein
MSYFMMSLAHELHMPKRQLLESVDSLELAEWNAYFKEARKPQEKKQDRHELEHKLKTFFSAKRKKKR